MKKFKEYNGFKNSARIDLVCDFCFENFQMYKCLYKSKMKNCGALKKNFCSKRCWYDYKSKNKITWNTGLTKETDKRLDYHRPTAIKKGQHLSPETEKKKGDCVGSKNNLWKGGIHPLNKALRKTDEYFKWRSEVFKRDNYTCKHCGIRGVQLNADHIKPFSKIYKEFLAQYSQFSPIEDKETLVRLASSYSDFHDINNGQTLCEDCHKKTETYLSINARI